MGRTTPSGSSWLAQNCAKSAGAAAGGPGLAWPPPAHMLAVTWGTARRRLPRLAPLFAVATVVCCTACGSQKSTQGFTGSSGGNASSGGGGSGSGGSTNPAVSVTVTPKTAQAALVATGTTYSATAMFTAEATFQDGSSRDITSEASWSSSDATSVAVSRGVAVAGVPGVFTVTAREGTAAGYATFTVTLSGPTFAGGLAPSDGAKLDGTPNGSGTPAIAYPLAGSLFPSNLAPVTVHVVKTAPTQAIARLAFTAAPLLALDYYAPCEPGPNAQTACYVTLPPAVTSLFAAASATTDITLQARLAASDGSALVESPPVSMAWAGVNLTGGLYYWTTIPPAQNMGQTGIQRYNFDGAASKPEVVYTDKGSPPDHVDGATCVGCHAITHDGTKMALTIGGSYPSDWMLLDVATKTQIVLRNQTSFATETTFNPDGSRMLNMFRGEFALHAVDASLMTLGGAVLGGVAEKKTDAFWSADGKLFAFVSWVPGQNGALPATDVNGLNGDTKQGGQIWTAPSDGMTIPDAATLLVPRAAGVTSFYPAVSDDDRLVVFDQSSCSGPPTAAGYGNAPCDGYDDVSSRLFVIPPAGGTPLALANANGADDSSNSWPRFSPDHGTFRGKTLYWIAFSSRRPYGLALDVAGDATGKPQLWFAAIALGNGTPTADPSFAPVWLPGQDPDLTAPNGNHVPQWVTKAVPIAQ